jgi:hypothetical protein
MGLDSPIMYPAPVGNGLDVNETLAGVPRRLAVQEESGDGRLSFSHVATH